eukprot:961057_1
MICKEEQTLASCEDKCEEGTIIYSTQGTEWIQMKKDELNADEEKHCIIFNEEMPESTEVMPEDSTDGESELSTLRLAGIIGGCVLAVVALIGCFALYWRCMYKVEKERPHNQPGSISGSFQRASIINLGPIEDNGEEESLNDDVKEGDGEDMEGNMEFHRQAADERVPSAMDVGKGNMSTAGIQGDGEGNDEVKQWLESTGFAQYYDNFVKNGINDLELIQAITEKADLEYL